MITIKNLYKKFGTVLALVNVSLQIKSGDLFGLVGPDGAGKTTLLRAVCGLLVPDSGNIQLRVNRSSPEGPAFGYMPQNFSLYGDLTVQENIMFFGSLYGLSRLVIKQRAEGILRLTNLIDFQQRLADHLSGGMKQKLALTCALIAYPPLLVLDEPTFGVDPESRKEFWKILYQLNREGMTILVSTPYMDEAELCKTVGFINGGKLAAVASPQQLKSNYPYTVVEVKATTRDPEFFRGLPEVVDDNFYGDKYLVVLRDKKKGVAAISAALQQQGGLLLAWREINPTMENVFVALAEYEVM